MREAIGDRSFCVGETPRAVHGLEQEPLEIQSLKASRVDARLRIDKLQLLPLLLNNNGLSLGTDADPVDSGWNWKGAIGFQRNAESAGVKSLYQRFVDLKQWLTASEDRQAIRPATLPGSLDRSRQRVRTEEASATRSIQADKIRVTEVAHRCCSVRLPT